MNSLAVKYRPQTLSDVIGQQSTVKVLQKQIETNQIKNALLFVGASGCGKTSLARAYANALNGGKGEPIEVDAASNSGVENVRTLIDMAKERSIDGGKYKIFILDEVHSFSNTAWQAWLKCIEEPPAYTIFIFCTTEPQKIPATILNRCMRFNFNRIPVELIVERLKYICRCEKISYEDPAIEFIAKLSDGGMRDAISTMEKVIDFGELNLQNTIECLGEYSYQTQFNLINALIDDNETTILTLIDSIYNSGSDLRQFINQFLNFSLDLTKYCIFNSMNLLKIPSILEAEIKNATSIENPSNYYMYVTNKLLELKNILKTDTNIKDTVEVCLLKIARGL